MSRQTEIWSLATSKLQRWVRDESQTHRRFAIWRKLLKHRGALPLMDRNDNVRKTESAQNLDVTFFYNKQKKDERQEIKGRPDEQWRQSTVWFTRCRFFRIWNEALDIASCVCLFVFGLRTHLTHLNVVGKIFQTVNALLVVQDGASPAMTHRMQPWGVGVNDNRALPSVSNAGSVFHCYATSCLLASC